MAEDAHEGVREQEGPINRRSRDCEQSKISEDGPISQFAAEIATEN